MKKTPEDLLREEYFDILPEIRKVTQELEARIRYALIPEIKALRPHEKIEIRSRAKDCESAINALRRRQETGDFVRASPSDYTLLELKDLAGARVLVFPNRLIEVVYPKLGRTLNELSGGWEEDHIESIDAAEYLALKCYGYINSHSGIYAECQVVPMVIGLFWEVEHAAIYKPMIPELKGISELMYEEIKGVEEALMRFDSRFDELLEKSDYEEKLKIRRRASVHYRKLTST